MAALLGLAFVGVGSVLCEPENTGMHKDYPLTSVSNTIWL